MNLKKLVEFGALQYGCFTRAQAVDSLGEDGMEYAVRAGTIERKQPGVYAIAGTPDDWIHCLMAAVISTPAGAASHQSAARLWGMTMVPSVKIAITVPYGDGHCRSDVTVHRSQQLNGFTTTHQGIPVTSVARTIVDIAGTLSRRRLSAVVDQAFNMKLVTLAELEHCLSVMLTKGRPGVTRLRDVLATKSVVDERLDSFLERRTLKWIRNAGYAEPIAQHRILSNGSAYRLDLCYPEYKIAIEPDGPHHLQMSIATYDRDATSTSPATAG